MSAKEAILQAVQDLPTNVSFDEALEHLEIMAALRQGEEDIDAGRVISHEDLKKAVAQWNAK